MNRLPELGATPRERSTTAESFAREHRIDLASAYSVLLGLMDLSEACSLKEIEAGSGHAIAGVPNSGDRSIRASALAFRHDLPMRLAFEVAEGKLSLDEALRRARTEANQPWPALIALDAPAFRPLPGRLAPVGIGLLIGGVLTLVIVHGTGEAMPPTTAAPLVADAPGQPANPPTRTRGLGGLPQVVDAPTYKTIATTDDQGRITRITGRTPLSILEAYCAAGGPDDPREPLEIAPSDPPRTGVRVGLLQRRYEPGRQFAIWLRLDGKSGEWFAGNGARPLEARPY